MSLSYPKFLVSFSGEIGVKAPGTRRDLEELTIRHLSSRAQAQGLSLQVERFFGRLTVSGPPEVEDLLRTHIGFGKVARLLNPSPEELTERSFWEKILPERPFTFVVYVDRVRPREFFPQVLEWKRGVLEILKAFAQERLARWDNHPPERLEIRLEVYEERVFLILWPRSGLGGLPPGCGERVLVLFSGGPDSLLAALLMARRGQEVGLLFMDDGEAGRLESVEDKARHLAYFFPEMKVPFYRLPYREILEYMAKSVPTRERCFFCKATMLRLAKELARKEGFSAVVTGEILGEQASQTLPALRFTAEASGVGVLRPLLGFNKEEVFHFLERVGLGEVARRQLPPCPFVPDHPHTRPESKPSRWSHLWPEIQKRVKKVEGKDLRKF